MNNRVLSYEEEKEYEMLKSYYQNKELHILKNIGETDHNGFPKNIVICSSSGLDNYAIYTMSESSQGGWE